MNFQIFHKYNRLVKDGLARPLACDQCGTEYTLMLGAEDFPTLHCFVCNNTLIPGLKLYSDIRAVVEEFYT